MPTIETRDLVDKTSWPSGDPNRLVSTCKTMVWVKEETERLARQLAEAR